MRICMILEGCYPYVRGGVSSWAHQYITAMPQHEFVLWVIGADSKDRGQYKYELPGNVTEIREVFLNDALTLPVHKERLVSFTLEEIEAHKRLISCSGTDWDLIFRQYNQEKSDVHSFLMSEDFLDLLVSMCRTDYPTVSFAELFHTVRSILLPTLYLISQEIPQADLYHSTSTGYAGLLGSLATHRTHKPFFVTEHGIYTREREEEILRASWVAVYFKQLWIHQFYTLSMAAYDSAVGVSSLFPRAAEVQREIGCPEEKQTCIFNGIDTDLFSSVPAKKPDGWTDIGAVVRFHPIKDIKTMIYAFFELKQRVPEVRLHILGDTDDPDYRRECLDLIGQLKVTDILIVGNTDVVKYMEKLDFTLLTSISEGQPLSVLESLAAGRPCVTTDVGCCRQLLDGGGIDGYGRAGFCAKPMQPQEIANDCEFLCRHPKELAAMGAVGRKRVLSSFRHADMIQNYLNFYERGMEKWRESDLN